MLSDLSVLIGLAAPASGSIAAFIYYLVYRQSPTGLFFCLLAVSVAIAFYAAITAIPAGYNSILPVASALSDFLLMGAGIACYAASRWVYGAFTLAGDQDEH